jgi:hypothetical protein
VCGREYVDSGEDEMEETTEQLRRSKNGLHLKSGLSGKERSLMMVDLLRHGQYSFLGGRAHAIATATPELLVGERALRQCHIGSVSKVAIER